jgi:putative transposase
LLAQRGVIVSYEASRLWVNKFGSQHARRLKKLYHGYGDELFIDEVFINIIEKQYYLWHAVDQDSLPRERSECFGFGDVIDVLLPAKRNRQAAERFFKPILNNHNHEIRIVTTDKLRSYNVAHRKLIPGLRHRKDQYSNNRAEQSPERTRVRERVMRKFTSMPQANQFLGADKEFYNFFNLNRNLIKSNYYRELREGAFLSWNRAVGI